MNWEEHERSKKALKILRDIGYPSTLGPNGTGVVISSQAAERLIRCHRPKFSLGPIPKHDPGPQPKED